MKLYLEFIQQNIFLVLLVLASGGAVLALSFRGPSGRKGITSTQAAMLINRENAQVIDVRTADEYAAGHLPDSQNIPLEHLEGRVGELEKFKDLPLILICQTGARSANACKQLEKLGFSRVHNLEGGIAGWRSARLPLEKGAEK